MTAPTVTNPQNDAATLAMLKHINPDADRIWRAWDDLGRKGNRNGAGAVRLLHAPDDAGTMSKHTPDPWFVEEYGDEDTPALVIHKDSENRICFMAMPGSHGDPERIAADARLIAASPKMLAALRLFDEFAWTAVVADCPEALNELNSRIAAARAAIAQAEGRS